MRNQENNNHLDKCWRLYSLPRAFLYTLCVSDKGREALRGEATRRHIPDLEPRSLDSGWGPWGFCKQKARVGPGAGRRGQTRRERKRKTEPPGARTEPPGQFHAKLPAGLPGSPSAGPRAAAPSRGGGAGRERAERSAETAERREPARQGRPLQGRGKGPGRPARP